MKSRTLSSAALEQQMAREATSWVRRRSLHRASRVTTTGSPPSLPTSAMSSHSGGAPPAVGLEEERSKGSIVQHRRERDGTVRVLNVSKRLLERSPAQARTSSSIVAWGGLGALPFLSALSLWHAERLQWMNRDNSPKDKALGSWQLLRQARRLLQASVETHNATKEWIDILNGCCASLRLLRAVEHEPRSATVSSTSSRTRTTQSTEVRMGVNPCQPMQDILVLIHKEVCSLLGVLSFQMRLTDRAHSVALQTAAAQVVSCWCHQVLPQIITSSSLRRADVQLWCEEGYARLLDVLMPRSSSSSTASLAGFDCFRTWILPEALQCYGQEWVTSSAWLSPVFTTMAMNRDETSSSIVAVIEAMTRSTLCQENNGETTNSPSLQLRYRWALWYWMLRTHALSVSRRQAWCLGLLRMQLNSVSAGPLVERHRHLSDHALRTVLPELILSCLMVSVDGGEDNKDAKSALLLQWFLDEEGGHTLARLLSSCTCVEQVAQAIRLLHTTQHPSIVVVILRTALEMARSVSSSVLWKAACTAIEPAAIPLELASAIVCNVVTDRRTFVATMLVVDRTAHDKRLTDEGVDWLRFMFQVAEIHQGALQDTAAMFLAALMSEGASQRMPTTLSGASSFEMLRTQILRLALLYSPSADRPLPTCWWWKPIMTVQQHDSQQGPAKPSRPATYPLSRGLFDFLRRGWEGKSGTDKMITIGNLARLAQQPGQLTRTFQICHPQNVLPLLSELYQSGSPALPLLWPLLAGEPMLEELLCKYTASSGSATSPSELRRLLVHQLQSTATASPPSPPDDDAAESIVVPLTVSLQLTVQLEGLSKKDYRWSELATPQHHLQLGDEDTAVEERDARHRSRATSSLPHGDPRLRSVPSSLLWSLRKGKWKDAVEFAVSQKAHRLSRGGKVAPLGSLVLVAMQCCRQNAAWSASLSLFDWYYKQCSPPSTALSPQRHSPVHRVRFAHVAELICVLMRHAAAARLCGLTLSAPQQVISLFQSPTSAPTGTGLTTVATAQQPQQQWATVFPMTSWEEALHSFVVRRDDRSTSQRKPIKEDRMASRRTFHALLCSLAQNDRWREAVRLVQLVNERPQSNSGSKEGRYHRFDLRDGQVLYRLLERHHQWSTALSLFPVVPFANSIDRFVPPLIENGQWETAFSLACMTPISAACMIAPGAMGVVTGTTVLFEPPLWTRLELFRRLCQSRELPVALGHRYANVTIALAQAVSTESTKRREECTAARRDILRRGIRSADRLARQLKAKHSAAKPQPLREAEKQFLDCYGPFGSR
jgi:hypothetical protein